MKHSHLISVRCGAVLTLATSLVHAVILPLESRLGGLAYYDLNLDITWATNTDINSVGSWDDQLTWVAGLTLGGVSGWRLPSADVNGDGVVANCFGGGVTGCADNEMGFLYWEEGITFTTAGPFILQFGNYWSGTEADIFHAWDFRFHSGEQLDALKFSTNFAWAVHSGDVGAVPLPATVWLFGSGLIGLVGITRISRKAA